MKITIATGPTFPVPAVRGGAVQRMWHGLAKEFAKRGHEVTILARAYPGQPEHENSDGIRIVRWGGYDQGTNVRIDLVKGLIYALGALGKVPAGDVVVTNDFWLPILLPWSRRKVGKVVASIARFPKGQFWLYGKVDRILAVSSAVAQGIKMQTPGIARKVGYIPNCVDEAFLRPREDIGYGISDIGKRQLTVLYVGRIHPEKGIEILIEAWRLLRERWRKADGISDMELAPSDLPSPIRTTRSAMERASASAGGLRISGKGKFEGKPISNIRDPICGCEAKLRIVGPWRKEQGGGGEEYLESLKRKVEGVEWGQPVFGAEELAKVYDSGDILVYPSQAELGEAMPLAPLEGMARGLPVVVSNLEVFKEYLVEGQNGVQFEHRGGQAAENLAGALAKLLEEPELRQRMSKEARATAERFSVQNVATMYLEAFRDMGYRI